MLTLPGGQGRLFVFFQFNTSYGVGPGRQTIGAGRAIQQGIGRFLAARRGGAPAVRVKCRGAAALGVNELAFRVLEGCASLCGTLGCDTVSLFQNADAAGNFAAEGQVSGKGAIWRDEPRRSDNGR